MRWGLVTVLSLFAVTFSVVRFRPRRTEIHDLRFHIPPADRISENLALRRNLVLNADGQLITLDTTGNFLLNSITTKPVFITGDAAWSLQVQLSDSDIQFYLSERALKGYNAILINLVDNVYSNNRPKDFYGNVPFNGADFTNASPTYWARVDQTFSWAAVRGITVIADPAFVGYNGSAGYCESYRASSQDVLRAYGEFLGNRYKHFSNIIWLIGGDADAIDNNVQSKLHALASGIRSKDSVHLITTENYRGTSSVDIWSETSWLDLDALYLLPSAIPAKANVDYKAGHYPVFLLEDWYEGEHSITDLEVRKEGYWAILSGCTLGRVFGNYAVWNFSWSRNTTEPWKPQLGSPGSVAQAWLGKLFRSREHWKLVPDVDHTVMTGGYGSRGILSSARDVLRTWVGRGSQRAARTLSVAARTSDGQTIIAYVPNGHATSITVDMRKIIDPGGQARGWWFNPRDGSTTLIGTFAARGTRDFTPPSANDWILVIDSAAANLAAPGSKDL